MTNQIQGEILFAGWSGTADGDWAYTPWMPVRADYATFGVEVLARNAAILTWDVQTRTVEDPAIGSPITTAVAMSSVTTATASNNIVAKCKQLFRYRFKTGGTASTTEYVIFRALQPSWQVDR
jgi:hypothetical protein